MDLADALRCAVEMSDDVDPQSPEEAESFIQACMLEAERRGLVQSELGTH